MVLDRCLNASAGQGGIASAVASFSKLRATEASALVRVSRSFDRPGALGFLTFVLPLILDGIFHGVAPAVFGPNTIAMLQRDGLTFQGGLGALQQGPR